MNEWLPVALFAALTALFGFTGFPFLMVVFAILTVVSFTDVCFQ